MAAAGGAGNSSGSSSAGSSNGSGGSGSSSSSSGSAAGGGCGAAADGSAAEEVSHEGALFLGLERDSQAPIFAADLGPEPPLLPDFREALAARAAAFGDLEDDGGAGSSGQQARPQGGGGGDGGGEGNATQQTCGERLAAWAAEQGYEFVDVRRQGAHMSAGTRYTAGGYQRMSEHTYTGGSAAAMQLLSSCHGAQSCSAGS